MESFPLSLGRLLSLSVYKGRTCKGFYLVQEAKFIASFSIFSVFPVSGAYTHLHARERATQKGGV